jgi:hypothetical protein
MASQRSRSAAARPRRVVTPETKARWAKAYKWSRYNLTQAEFDRLLEAQGHACGMCREPFRENSAVCVDHDHACCPHEKRSCGKCICGLLCLSCNTALGHIERKLDLARVYLAAPPTQIAPTLKIA